MISIIYLSGKNCCSLQQRSNRWGTQCGDKTQGFGAKTSWPTIKKNAVKKL